MERQHVMRTAGGAQIDRVGTARGLVEMPGLGEEGRGRVELGQLERDAAQAGDGRRGHRQAAVARLWRSTCSR
jgi:hypothetical protein